MGRVVGNVDSQVTGVLGATGLIGRCFLRNVSDGGDRRIVAFTRQKKHAHEKSDNNCAVRWRTLNLSDGCQEPVLRDDDIQTIEHWLCFTPIWVLPDYFSMLVRFGARRVVAISSTSRLTKASSSDMSERLLARRLIEAENKLIDWAGKSNIEWVILRPTLIYGCGADKNISEVSRLIDRFGMLPVFGKAQGLRQPVHASDVAEACRLALSASAIRNKFYNISGAEILPYREMLSRVFIAMGRQPKFVRLPLAAFRIVVCFLHIFPRFSGVTVAIAERMNRNMIFTHKDASHDFGYSPRAFVLEPEDLP
ncbi:MAG TPA: NAD-dependent epimerase/dehydratase family protein [Acidiferrobacteraceae bacterium]|nr:NAD-dependent epimerase/dehydratase family protein [Acidiferrobacteraceae bacterium]